MGKCGTSENTDRELWRENKDDYYGDSIFVTKEGAIGMNCRGRVKVKTIAEWFHPNPLIDI